MLPQKELLFIYRIFMESSFNSLPKENLYPSFIKRKIKSTSKIRKSSIILARFRINGYRSQQQIKIISIKYIKS